MIEQTVTQEFKKNTPMLVGRVVFDEESSAFSSLSPRQREIAGMAVLGHKNEEIATKLNVSIKTVETHRASINKRLGVRSTSSLVLYAVACGALKKGKPE